MQLLIYTKQITSRLEYIFSTLLLAAGIKDFQLATDSRFFSEYAGPKINYSRTLLSDNEVHISPVELLFETGVQPQKIDVFLWGELPAFFKSPGEHLPFDIFAASFYLVTRYEEYLPHALDMYGRYAHENSLAFQHNFLSIPIVNRWFKKFSRILQQHFPALSLKPSAFSFLPTYDIDIAWSYLHKGWLRSTGGFVKSVVRGEWARVKERMSVLKGRLRDPFDAYDWLDALHAETSLQPVYFFLVAQQNKGYDKNILPSEPAYQKLIKQHSSNYNIGIHPSWQSGDDNKSLKDEIEQLHKIAGKAITKSRQHYIRMHLPTTYRKLIEVGITQDYSMGYGSINGFRASYCLPYKWYDFENETTTPLVVNPFCYMEANSFYEQKYSASETQQELEHYYNVTKGVDGSLITIWHNHFLGTDKMFAGWKEMYEGFVRKHF